MLLVSFQKVCCLPLKKTQQRRTSMGGSNVFFLLFLNRPLLYDVGLKPSLEHPLRLLRESSLKHIQGQGLAKGFAGAASTQLVKPCSR